MPKLTRTDPSLLAKNVLDHMINKYDPGAAQSVAITDSTFDDAPRKYPATVARGKLGGSKGVKARAASLSPAKRKRIARKTAKARWENLNKMVHNRKAR